MSVPNGVNPWSHVPSGDGMPGPRSHPGGRYTRGRGGWHTKGVGIPGRYTPWKVHSWG